MAIQPISGVGGVSVPTASSADYMNLTDASPAHAALALSLAKESESLEQRANDGDPEALTQLAEELKQLTPIDSQQLLPPPLQPPPAGSEPGKGILIDIYD